MKHNKRSSELYIESQLEKDAYNASILLMVIINAILGFGTEFISITSNYIRQTFMNQLEYKDEPELLWIFPFPH